MRLDDFVLLGTTVPEVISDGREAVCSAGYSQEFGSLLRLYPLSRFDAPRRWHRYRVNIEKNPRDSRAESYALRGDRRIDHAGINRRSFTEAGRVDPLTFSEIVDRHSVSSIYGEDGANARRLSLAFIRPRNPILDFDYNTAAPDAPQLKLLPVDPSMSEGSKRFPYVPRIRFDDADGHHNLSLRDWGSFEFLRKFPRDHAGLKRNLKLNEEPVFLIGNHAQHRTSWLVISVLHVAPQLSLLGREVAA